MNQKKQRIAIAGACGWVQVTRYVPYGDTGIGEMQFAFRRDEEIRYKHSLPDYLNSLDAMHEAEMQIIYRDGHDSDLACDYRANLVIAANAGMMCSATAAQRAEAFLKTLGLWTEEE